MINKIVLVGRLTRDLEIRKTRSNKSVLNFTMAVDRRFKSENGERETDFIECVAWEQSAEYLGRYAGKGDIIGVDGELHINSYEKNGQKVYRAEVQCETVKIISSKQNNQSQNVSEIVSNTTYKAVENEHDAEYAELDFF